MHCLFVSPISIVIKFILLSARIQQESQSKFNSDYAPYLLMAEVHSTRQFFINIPSIIASAERQVFTWHVAYLLAIERLSAGPLEGCVMLFKFIRLLYWKSVRRSTMLLLSYVLLFVLKHFLAHISKSLFVLFFRPRATLFNITQKAHDSRVESQFYVCHLICIIMRV